jgi:(1->4)-alpha-D-glucan 1-alpha-D-glucosylmutase
MANRKFKKRVNDAEAPDANEEYLLYQTLLGTWPMDASGAPVPVASEQYVSRIQQYMTKALKEAKLNTSWIQPNAEWDNAVTEFIANILAPGPRNKFLAAFLPVGEEIARLGAINSLAQMVLKLTSPGVPDIYQGTEVWDDSLVDPDNRRPVDYARRREILAEVQNASPEELLQCWPDGQIKMRVMQRLLHLRRGNAELFHEGEYEALKFGGTFAECAIGFVRRRNEETVLVIVPRISSRVGFPPTGEKWQDTAAMLPKFFEGKVFKDIFCTGRLRVENSRLRLADAMWHLPFAVLKL